MENVILFIVLVVILAIVISKQKSKPGTKTGVSGSGSHSQSGLLGYQESQTKPKVDSAGRIIVKIKGGSPGVKWGVNRSHLDQEVANKLAGKVSDDEEISKSIKVRIRQDSSSQYENSILVETTSEKFIGWILKDNSSEAVSVLSQIESALTNAAPDLQSSDFVFEVSAKIEGYWNEIGENDVEEWEAELDLMEIRIKTPAEIEVD